MHLQAALPQPQKALVPGQPEYELIPVRPDEFDVKGAKGISIIFERDEKGNVPACLFVQPNGKFRVTKISNVKTENPAEIKMENKQSVTETGDLEKYVGEYDLGRQTVKIFTDADKLKAIIPGQPEYELISAKEREFNIKGVKGISVKFDTDDKANITGFTMMQPNGTIKATKIIK